MRSRVNSSALAMKTRFEHSSRIKGLVREEGGDTVSVHYFSQIGNICEKNEMKARQKRYQGQSARSLISAIVCS